MPDQIDTVGELIAARRSDLPERIVLNSVETLDSESLDRRSRALSAALIEAGTGRGTHVGLLASNSVEWVVGWLGITRIGAVAVLLSTVSTPAELRHMIIYGDVQIILSGRTALKVDLEQRLRQALFDVVDIGVPIRATGLPLLRHVWFFGDSGQDNSVSARCAAIDAGALGFVDAVESGVRASHPAVLIFTSGTRAEPKAVIHSHGTVTRQAASLAALRRLTADDRLLALMPFFWVGGLAYDLLAALHAGATIVLPSSLEPGSILRLISSKKITRVSAWPNQVRALREHPSFSQSDFSHVIEGLVDGGMDVDAMGMTETFGPHSGFALRTSEPWQHGGSFGPALAGIERQCVDPDSGMTLMDGEEGELWLRGPTLMLGYYKRTREEAFTNDGWFRTGDKASIDSQGNVGFSGRLSGMIKTGGANVAPAEVEAAISALPGVIDSAAMGLADANLGEIVGAVALVSPGRRNDKDEMRAALQQRLAGYKIPRVFLLLPADEVNMTASGKLRRSVAEALLLTAIKPADSAVRVSTNV